jgi:hypothetical protein
MEWGDIRFWCRGIFSLPLFVFVHWGIDVFFYRMKTTQAQPQFENKVISFSLLICLFSMPVEISHSLK